MSYIEVRCPVGPRKLFAILRNTGQTPHITDDNLLEMACPDCKRSIRKSGETIERVLHRYNLIGELIETIYLK